ncbi:MAG TPA: hypothetical protein VGF79_11095 [Bacteroidia bacterium]
MKYFIIVLLTISNLSVAFGQNIANDDSVSNKDSNGYNNIYVFKCTYQIDSILKIKSLFVKIDDCYKNPQFEVIKLSDSICMFRNLEVLYIGSIKAVILPDSFNCLKRLKNIEYSGPLTNSTLPQTFQLYNLETISFGDVMTSNFPLQLLKLPKLRMIGISYSPLYSKEFRIFIKGILKLEHLENINVMLPINEDDKFIKNKLTKKDIRWLKRLMKKNKIECYLY